VKAILLRSFNEEQKREKYLISGLTVPAKLFVIQVGAVNPISGLLYGAISLSSRLPSILDIKYHLDTGKFKR